MQFDWTSDHKFIILPFASDITKMHLRSSSSLALHSISWISKLISFCAALNQLLNTNNYSRPIFLSSSDRLKIDAQKRQGGTKTFLILNHIHNWNCKTKIYVKSPFLFRGNIWDTLRILSWCVRVSNIWSTCKYIFTLSCNAYQYTASTHV